MKIIDAQVDFGKNIFGPNCDIENYIKNAKKIGIKEALLIPTNTHSFKKKDGELEKSCIWSLNNKGVSYEKIIIKDEHEQKIINPKNPYTDFNNHTLEVIKSKNKEGLIKFYFIPKLHPKLDEPEELERLLEKEEAIALKIQGIATYCSPKDIPLWVPELLKKYEKPLMVHTDYLNKNFVDYKQGYREIIRKNNPFKWAIWAVKNNIKTYLAHGIRLDEECAELVNKSENLVVGLGPDLMIQAESWRLKLKTENYINSLFEILDESKVLFSTDFAWNYKNPCDRNLDWGTIDRIKGYAHSKKKGDKFLNKIFCKNSEDFFDLER